MNRVVFKMLGATIFLFAPVWVTVAQVQTTTVVQSPNGMYSIVEYPVGKETTVTLNPVTAALGKATIRRDPTGSTININLTNVPYDWNSLYAYAVEPNGTVTNLGAINPVNGSATFTAKTPLSRFMLVVSPEPGLTAYDVNTRVYLRSAVPSGLTVLPFSGSASAVGEQVSTMVMSEYRVPMLGIPTFKVGDETKLKINFTGAMEGSRANVFIKPHSHARATEVEIHFHDLKEAPKNTVYTLWAVSPSDEYQRLGSIVNVRGKNEAEIKSETTFNDFGLMITAEEAGTAGTIVRPSGRRVGVIEIIK